MNKKTLSMMTVLGLTVASLTFGNSYKVDTYAKNKAPKISRVGVAGMEVDVNSKLKIIEPVYVDNTDLFNYETPKITDKKEVAKYKKLIKKYKATKGDKKKASLRKKWMNKGLIYALNLKTGYSPVLPQVYENGKQLLWGKALSKKEQEKFINKWSKLAKKEEKEEVDLYNRPPFTEKEKDEIMERIDKIGFNYATEEETAKILNMTLEEYRAYCKYWDSPEGRKKLYESQEETMCTYEPGTGPKLKIFE